MQKRSSRSVDYAKKLKDPRWQKKRLEVFDRDGWACQNCGVTSETLHVHHKIYRHIDPWESSVTDLITLCESCHEYESSERLEVEKKLLQTLKKAGLLTCQLEEIIHYYQMQNEYFDLLKDEKWQSLEKKLLQNNTCCTICSSEKDIVIHHKNPSAFLKNPWEFPDEDFDLICKNCNRKEFSNRLGDELILLSVLKKAGFLYNDISDFYYYYDFQWLKDEIAKSRQELCSKLNDENSLPNQYNEQENSVCTLKRIK